MAASMAKPKRSDRVAERIRTELMDLLIRGVVRDARAEGAVVTAVRVSDDLRHATVYVRIARPDVSEAAAHAAVEALNRARGFLRRELTPRLGLKYQPDIAFAWDAEIDRAARVERLLAEIADEKAGRGEPQ
jgi:ribosome-binding factor A